MTTVSEVMTANPVAAQGDDTIQQVASQMQQGDFGSMPIVDAGKVVGVVTDRDIAVRAVAKGISGDQPVREIMSADPVCVAPDCTVQQAAQLMQERQLRRLYVQDGDKLEGVVALKDVALEVGDQLSGQTLEEISRR